MTRLPASLTLLTTAILSTQCTQETLTISPQQENEFVDPRLVPYFKSFQYEASLRGIDVDYEAFPITGYIQSIQEDDIAGTCNYHSYEPNVVTIDLEYWNSVSTLRREMVVFHELGHCVLGRGHTETAFSNGICTTLMNSGTSGCYVAYTADNRDYYLGELFGQ